MSTNATGDTVSAKMKELSKVLFGPKNSARPTKNRLAVATVTVDEFEAGTTRIQEILNSLEGKNSQDECVESAIEESQECNDNIKELIFDPSLPPYSPPLSSDEGYNASDFFSCKECGDRFVLESSLEFHMDRRSILVSYECVDCGSTVTVYNRCSLLAHFRLHGDPNNFLFDSLNITVSPLPREKMLIGPLPKSIMDVGGRAETCPKSNSLVSTPPEDKDLETDAESEHCGECNSSIKGSLRDHILGSNLPLDHNITCKECNLILPTKCSFKAHERCHKQERPFICPECGKLFHLWASFAVHLYYTCFHMDKCVRYLCPKCKLILISSATLEVHILTLHVKNVFKCNACPIACFTVQALQDHKQKNHQQPSLPTNAYQQCQLCPDRLIPKSRILFHVMEHVAKPEVRLYGYFCTGCKCFFLKKSDFASHKSKCPTVKGTPDDSATSSTNNNSTIHVQSVTSKNITNNNNPTIQSVTSKNITNEGIKILQTVKPGTVVKDGIKILQSKNIAFSFATTNNSSNTTSSSVLKKAVHLKILPKRPISRFVPLLPKGSLSSINSNLDKTPVIQKHLKLLPTAVLPISPINTTVDESQIMIPKAESACSVEKDPLSLDDMEESNSSPSTLPLKDSFAFHSKNGSCVIRMCVVCRKELIFHKPTGSSLNFPVCCSSCSKKKLLKKGRLTIKPKLVNLNKIEVNALTGGNTEPDDSPSVEEQQLNNSNHSIALNGPLKEKRTSSEEKSRYRCHICKALIEMDWEIIQEHFSKEHKNVNFMVLSPRINKVDMDANTEMPVMDVRDVLQSEASNKNIELIESDASVNDRREEEDDLSDSPKVKRRKRVSSKDNKANSITPFSYGQLIVPIETPKSDQKYVCSKCKLAHDDIESFRSHIVTHKEDSSAYQCMECGMCFVVKPSFEKHLFIYHRIKDVDLYIENNEFCHEKQKKEAEETEVTPNKEGEPLEDNQCSVCKLKCENSIQLNKHFRSHGMAYLLMKQRENKIALQS